MPIPHDARILLDVRDGPEGITIYTSEERGIADWADTATGLYVDMAVVGASVILGPFALQSTVNEIIEKLDASPGQTVTCTGPETAPHEPFTRLMKPGQSVHCETCDRMMYYRPVTG